MPKEGHNPITCIAYKLYHYNQENYRHTTTGKKKVKKKKEKTLPVQATHKLSIDSKGVFYPTIPANK